MRREDIAKKVILIICNEKDINEQTLWPCNKIEINNKKRERVKLGLLLFNDGDYVSVDRDTMSCCELELDNEGFEFSLPEDDDICVTNYSSSLHGIQATIVNIEHPLLGARFPGITFSVYVSARYLLTCISKYGVVNKKILCKFCFTFSGGLMDGVVVQDETNKNYVLDKWIGEQLENNSINTTIWKPGHLYYKMNTRSMYVCLGTVDSYVVPWGTRSINFLPCFSYNITSFSANSWTYMYNNPGIIENPGKIYIVLDVTNCFEEFKGTKCSEAFQKGLDYFNNRQSPCLILFACSKMKCIDLGSYMIDDAQNLEKKLRDFSLNTISNFSTPIDKLDIYDSCGYCLLGLGKEEITESTPGYDRIYKYTLLYLKNAMKINYIEKSIREFIATKNPDQDMIHDHIVGLIKPIGINIKVKKEDILAAWKEIGG